MVVTIFLAHLVGDYVLQGDSLARWKSRELKGVLTHGLIVGAVTWLLSLLIDPGWWPWAIAIWLTHTAVDAVPLALNTKISFQGSGTAALARFLIDQTVHVVVILAALVGSGYLTVPSLAIDLLAALRDNRWLAITLGYAFITMPAWILVEFLVYGLVNGSAPDFAQATNKYVSILERGLITTFVMTGQFMLVPVVTLPRLVLEGPRVAGSRQATLYVAELLASVALAVAIGLALRRL
jgi:hypothetical protein